MRDYIVEERTWRRGHEIISHVNLSQIGRIRRQRRLLTGTGRTSGRLDAPSITFRLPRRVPAS